jgi:hypothetical protein
MGGIRNLMSREHQMRGLALGATLTVCVAGFISPAAAQAPPIQANPLITQTNQLIGAITGVYTSPLQPLAGDVTGLAQATGLASGPFAPPLNPPVVGALPPGTGSLSLGNWLLTPVLGLSTFYNSNIYSSVTNPLSGPAFNAAPSLLAAYNTGFFDTQLYANMGSTIYPTLPPANNTFNWQGGFVEKYSPLRDLVFTLMGNVAHSTTAFATTSALPTPITSPANPGLPGAAGVAATQQSVINANDTYTLTATAYKEFNRAYVNVGATTSSTQYQGSTSPSSTPLANYLSESYYGNGGVWITPLFFAYANGVEAFTNPSVGLASTGYRAVGGIGTAPISLFRVSGYYGQQGSQVVDSGTAGGPVYGGLVSYSPTDVWNVDLSIDRVVNISNLTAAPGQGGGLPGVPTIGVAVPLTESVAITTVTLRSNYTFSPQTSIFGVLSNSSLQFIGSTRLDTSRLASVGVQQRLSNNLSLTGNFQYTSYQSPEPLTSFTDYLVSVGAIYNF